MPGFWLCFVAGGSMPVPNDEMAIVVAMQG